MTHDPDAIGEVHHFFKVVADDNHADALFLEALNQRMYFGAFVHAERRCWLIKNHQLRSPRDGSANGDSLALTTLRALKSAIKNAAIEKGGADAELSDGEVVNVIRKQLKQREDSIEQFEKAGRSELVEKEKTEMTILERYLPAALSPEEVARMVDEAVAATGAATRADMGKVMKILQEKAAGRIDGKTLSQEVMKRLG